jgi:hypothetical protein
MIKVYIMRRCLSLCFEKEAFSMPEPYLNLKWQGICGTEEKIQFLVILVRRES